MDEGTQKKMRGRGRAAGRGYRGRIKVGYRREVTVTTDGYEQLRALTATLTSTATTSGRWQSTTTTSKPSDASQGKQLAYA